MNARGSVAEILDHALEAKSWDYIDDATLNRIRKDCEKCLQLINGYIRYLRNQNERQ
ncbi:four helix bundle protein [Echinicola salinicaeni]|uniref:four helix bundle protein n=1 Tax=Echinicola salinicaeni TaxID=2762757 RepID=UPI001648804E